MTILVEGLQALRAKMIDDQERMVDEHQREIDNHQREIIGIVEESRREIAKLDFLIAQTPQDEKTNPALAPHPAESKPARFKGMKVAVALQVYLRELGGGPIPLDEAVEALEKGECLTHWVRADKKHNLRITLSNNKSKFFENPEMDTVRLTRPSDLRI